jgi:hypothetical protein
MKKLDAVTLLTVKKVATEMNDGHPWPITRAIDKMLEDAEGNHFFLNGKKFYVLETPIHGADVRCKMPPECVGYGLEDDWEKGDSFATKHRHYSDSDVIPSGTKILMVPPAGIWKN